MASNSSLIQSLIVLPVNSDYIWLSSFARYNRLIRYKFFDLQLICAMSGAFPMIGNTISTGAGGIAGNSWQQLPPPSSPYRFVSYPGRITNVNPSPPSPNSVYNAWGGFYNPTNQVVPQAPTSNSLNNWGQAPINSPISPMSPFTQLSWIH